MAPRRKPLIEHLTLRLDEELAGQIEEEASRREDELGVEISRGALVRYLIRVGLEVVKRTNDRG